MQNFLGEIKEIRGTLLRHEERLSKIESTLSHLNSIAEKNQDLLRYVVIGLMAIVGTVVGLKLWPA